MTARRQEGRRRAFPRVVARRLEGTGGAARGARGAWERLPPKMRAAVLILWRAARWYGQDNAGIFAAAIAYYALFSLLPVAFITLSLLGLLVPEDRVVSFVFEQVPLRETPEVQEDVQGLVSRARSLSPAGLGAGILLLLWSASGVFSAVRRGLDATSHRTTARPYWHGKLVDFALVPSLALLVAVSLGLTVLAQFFVAAVAGVGPAWLAGPTTWRTLSLLLAAAVSFTMFTLLYRFVPSSRPRWHEALAGAGCATVLFEGTKNLAAYVLRLTAVGQDPSLYAGFGTAMVFLFWMMLNATILLFGAEFGRAVGQTARELRERSD